MRLQRGGNLGDSLSPASNSDDEDYEPSGRELRMQLDRYIREDNQVIIEDLLDQTPELLNKQNRMGETPIMTAIRNNLETLMDFFIDYGERRSTRSTDTTNLMIKNIYNENAIFLAINKKASHGIIQTLLQANPELFFSTYKSSSTDDEEVTPLRYIKMLLDRLRSDARVRGSNFEMLGYYADVEEILLNFYNDYEQFYTSESNPMRIDLEGQFIQSPRRQRPRRGILGTIIDRARRARARQANQTRRSSRSSRANSTRSSPRTRSRRGSHASSTRSSPASNRASTRASSRRSSPSSSGTRSRRSSPGSSGTRSRRAVLAAVQVADVVVLAAVQVADVVAVLVAVQVAVLVAVQIVEGWVELLVR